MDVATLGVIDTEHIYTVVTYPHDGLMEHLVRSSYAPECVEFIVEQILHGSVYCYAPSSATTLRHHPMELPVSLEQMVQGWWRPSVWHYKTLCQKGYCLSVFTDLMKDELDQMRRRAECKSALQLDIEAFEKALAK